MLQYLGQGWAKAGTSKRWDKAPIIAVAKEVQDIKKDKETVNTSKA